MEGHALPPLKTTICTCIRIRLLHLVGSFRSFSEQKVGLANAVTPDQQKLLLNNGTYVTKTKKMERRRKKVCAVREEGPSFECMDQSEAVPVTAAARTGELVYVGTYMFSMGGVFYLALWSFSLMGCSRMRGSGRRRR